MSVFALGIGNGIQLSDLLPYADPNQAYLLQDFQQLQVALELDGGADGPPPPPALCLELRKIDMVKGYAFRLHQWTLNQLALALFQAFCSRSQPPFSSFAGSSVSANQSR